MQTETETTLKQLDKLTDLCGYVVTVSNAFSVVAMNVE
jgi:hypothetical protein